MPNHILASAAMGAFAAVFFNLIILIDHRGHIPLSFYAISAAAIICTCIIASAILIHLPRAAVRLSPQIVNRKS